MKILKRVVVIIILSLVVGTAALLLVTYTPTDGNLLLGLKNMFSQKSDNSNIEKDTSFSDYADSVVDSDLGVVRGTSEKNSTAAEFQKWLTSRWAADKDPTEPIDTSYDFFAITVVGDNYVEARMNESSEEITLTLQCTPENTALFKSFNMVFVSANFEIIEEIKPGDMLYAKCAPGPSCQAVGPDCLLIRRPAS